MSVLLKSELVCGCRFSQCLRSPSLLAGQDGGPGWWMRSSSGYYIPWELSWFLPPGGHTWVVPFQVHSFPWAWGMALLWVSESRSVVCDSLRPQGLYNLWNSPVQNAGVSSLSLLQGIFPTQGWNPGLPRGRQVLYQLCHRGSPLYMSSNTLNCNLSLEQIMALGEGSLEAT